MIDEKVKSPTYPGKPSTQQILQQQEHSADTPIQTKNAEKENSRKDRHANPPTNQSRRAFLGKAGGMTAMAVAAAMVPLEPLLGGKESTAEASVIPYNETPRVKDSFLYRRTEAQNERINPGVLPDNGDADRFSDHSGTWSKALIHDSLEIVDPTSYNSLIHALTSGNFNDFENVLVGNPGGTNFNAQFNGPQTALAFDLEGLDSHATVIPPAPTTASAQTADEEVEHYWAAMLRDINFNEYPSNPIAIAAANELNGLTYIRSLDNNEYPFPVTPQNLFRGRIVAGDGNVQGPYISQLLLQPTFFGAQPISQMYRTFMPNQNFMTSVAEFKNVQNGYPPSGILVFDPTFRHIRNGRDLTSYTHVDVLHEAHFIAFLVLAGINAPLNPGNPYGTRQHGGTSIGNRSEHGFGTLDPADCSATLPEVATRALKAAWFHKWIINLRQRPEEYGALVQARLAPDASAPIPQASAVLHPDVLNSQAVARTFSEFGTYLLPQAFPEGAPPHPCYPTGHGTVAGACLTVLKFFFDGSQKIRPLLLAAGSDVMQSSPDGLSLVPYTGADRDTLTINGEISKLAFNISFGHGIHSGIHFRSSTRASILLGEQVAISVLKDRAQGYNEPFTISLTKFDGTAVTFNNVGNDPFDSQPDTACP